MDDIEKILSKKVQHSMTCYDFTIFNFICLVVLHNTWLDHLTSSNN